MFNDEIYKSKSINYIHFIGNLMNSMLGKYEYRFIREIVYQNIDEL